MLYEDLIGKKWERDGRGPERYDCYGVLVEIYKRLGRNIPEYKSGADSFIHQQILEGKELCEELPRPEPMCMVLIGIIPHFDTHIGVVLGDCKRFIHATKAGVVISKLDQYKSKIKGYYRWKKA